MLVGSVIHDGLVNKAHRLDSLGPRKALWHRLLGYLLSVI
jgi:hypothetical protein